MRVKLIHFIVLSVVLHLGLTLSYFPKLTDFKFLSKDESRPLKIRSIRTVGKRDMKAQDLAYIPPEVNTNTKSIKKQTIKGKDNVISAADLQATKPSPYKYNKRALLPSPAIKSLNINRTTVKNFLRNSHNAQSSGEYERVLGKSNVLVKLEVPKGVPEDELNKYELVFYSFRKRTALNYINSFYNELNDFSTTNPHLKFPMTEKEETLTGRVTYDQNGEVVKIKMIKWSQTQKLQDFFLEVIKDMNSLPNPPKVIVKDGEFHVYYSLTLNKKIY